MSSDLIEFVSSRAKRRIVYDPLPGSAGLVCFAELLTWQWDSEVMRRFQTGDALRRGERGTVAAKLHLGYEALTPDAILSS